jgi:hypothetical protein
LSERDSLTRAKRALTALAVVAAMAPVITGLAGPARGQSAEAPVASAAQRVVLYEEDPANPQGRRYVGSAAWRAEFETASDGAHELLVRSNIEIPERRITMTFSLRRNSDRSLPASHVIAIT